MHRNPFSDAEITRRHAALRTRMAALDLDVAIVSSPENIVYLTGLDHWGYFAPTMLIVPRDSTPVLTTREMERVSIETMVRAADFRGHADTTSVAEPAADMLAGLSPNRTGLEMQSAGLPHALAAALMDQAPGTFTDISGLVDDLRQIKSAEEQALIRRAAAATNAATAAAIDAIHDGAREEDVAAACLAAMTRAGGEPPGFGPFIRPGTRLGEEHTTWGHGQHHTGTPVFLELSGCAGRYHAPNGRLVHVGPVPDADAAMAEVAKAAFAAVLGALTPGSRARDVYAAWQGVVDDAGLAQYRRHHCGYAVGIGVPPSWTGGNRVVGLRHDSDMEIAEGMAFHVLSWLMGTGQGDFFCSDTVLLGPDGSEVLTTTPQGPISR
ncbi:MAG: Xaa-Pro peptidase family protein [Pseudomonadota bacterium]